MSAFFATLVPWIVGGAFALLAAAGVYFRGKSTGKTEVRTEVATKTQEQAAVAAKEVRNVDVQIDRLPDGGAADQLKRHWLRK